METAKPDNAEKCAYCRAVTKIWSRLLYCWKRWLILPSTLKETDSSQHSSRDHLLHDSCRWQFWFGDNAIMNKLAQCCQLTTTRIQFLHYSIFFKSAWEKELVKDSVACSQMTPSCKTFVKHPIRWIPSQRYTFKRYVVTAPIYIHAHLYYFQHASILFYLIEHSRHTFLFKIHCLHKPSLELQYLITN